MLLPPIDDHLLVKVLVDLLKTPSPTGFSEEAMRLTERILRSIPGITTCRTRKGGLLATFEGQKNDAPRALAAHIDTLGAMVKTIKPNGKLTMSMIGGYAWNSIEGEGCTIFTREGKRFRGSILVNVASGHVYGEKTREAKRDQDSMEIRLDEKVNSVDSVKELGINVGDFISFDPRVELNNGFIRSRHLDDKAGVACLVEAARALQGEGLKPSQTTYLFISNFEEVGHGASAGIPAEVVELVCVDMATVGDGQTSDEYHATICVKDSGGPYHHGLSNRLRQLADVNAIPYKVDIFPYYGSDGGAYWQAGGDVAIALIGPGVDASHNYERTHIEALRATTNWALAYLLG